MKKRLQSKLNMYLVVRKQMESEKETMEVLPGFVANCSDFDDCVQQIVEFNELQNFSGTGITAEKDELKMQLAKDAAIVTSKVLSYARFNKVTALIPDVNYSESLMKRMSTQNLLGAAGAILIRGTENLPKMSEFLLTQAELDQLKQSISAYRDASSMPRIQRTMKKFKGRNLESCVAAADSALEKIDIVVELIRYTKPDVYQWYKSARKLEMVANTYLSLKGSVKDATTSEPITAAQIKFVEVNSAGDVLGDEEPVLTKSTASKGGFLVKSLAEGNYRVTVSKIGYKDKTIQVTVTASEMQDLELMLESA